MSLGRKQISAVLLAIGAFLFFITLLAANSSMAQTDGDCPGAKEVNKTTGNGNKQSPVFNITGTSFRVTVDSTATSTDPQVAGITVWVYPEGQTSGSAGNFRVEEGRDDSSIINAGPGRFYLDLNTANVEYTVTVEDCTGTSSGTTEESEISDPQKKDPPLNQKRREKVDKDTIPKKRLVNTGGVSASYIVYGSVFAGASLLALTLVVRRRP